MKRRIIGAGVLLLAVSSITLFESCASANQMAQVIATLRRLQFKIGGVSSFRIAGIEIGGKSTLSQFSAGDGLSLFKAYASKRLPVDFVVDLNAINPNTGTGGTPRTTSTLSSLECRLLIDGRPTVTGNIDRPVEVPGTGQATVFPIRLTLDLFEFFGEKRYEDLISLALAIGGASKTPSHIVLDAQPVVTTPVGNIAYPGRIMIVDSEFR